VPFLASLSVTTIELVFMAAALLFVVGIKRLSGVKTAKSGARLAAVGMFVAVAATLVFLWGEGGLLLIALGVGIGAVVGAVLALRVPMTSMPEMVALLNGFGGAASLCVALAEVSRFGGLEELGTATRTGGTGPITLLTGYATKHGAAGGFDYAAAIVLSILIGAVTFSGSLVAFAKLSGKLNKSRLAGLGSQKMNLAIGLVTLGVLVWAGFVAAGSGGLMTANLALAALALVLGIGLVVGIGGADMPVVISLLNSYSGIAAAMTGFVIKSEVLVISGALVGSSGIILSQIMCKAMNRSLSNVLFGAFGATAGKSNKTAEGLTVSATNVEEAALMIAYAQSVIVVPGYGLAVAQAQHQVRELMDLVEKRGGTMKFAVHPVAGRMPGHMNVLLAEANIPYDKLIDMDDINPEFERTDVCLVIGANDVVNPAARTDPSSPIFGMPILNADQAKRIIVFKRGMSAGFAGIENELFYNPKTQMLFGDAKGTLSKLVAEVKQV
jgi:NAD(P) transhydrogenase subunit beta